MHNLSWLATEPKWTDGLLEKIDEKEDFITIRLGINWFNKVQPWDMVNISITVDINEPSKICLGQAEVLITIVDTIRSLRESGTALLFNNIGAKNWDEVLKDMKKIYGEDKVTENSTISVIELRPK